MGSTSGQRRRPQKYPEELRERAVRMVFEVRERSGEKHGVITRVARELGIGTESLRNWVHRAEIDSGRRAGTSSADAQRIASLEKENRELRRANDILKAGGCRTNRDHPARVSRWAGQCESWLTTSLLLIVTS
jgi:transposase